MDIGIHAVPAFALQPTGVEVYARELIAHLSYMAAEEGNKCILYTNQSGDIEFPSAEVRVLQAKRFWTQLRLSSEMSLNPPDVLFVPANALPRKLPHRTVLTMHGVEFLQSPEHFTFRSRYYLTALTNDGVRRADHIIAVSSATKQAIMERFGASESRISVVHLGAPVPPKNIEKIDRKKPYLLFVGRLETHKNVDGLIRAFNMYLDLNPTSEVELLLAGKRGFGYKKIRKTIASSDYRDSIHELGYVSESQKWSLLSGAVAFCFPSHSEGFGIPILEAQVAGVPVITSDVTAMPEVSGNAAILIDPTNIDEIARGITSLVSDRGLRERLISLGRKNITRFSWDAAARSTLGILTSS